jgi:glycosyltransferase EpsD
MKRKILFTSHVANFQKFNRPLMRMLRGTLEEPYKDLNIGGWQVDYASANEEEIKDADNVFKVDFARHPKSIIKNYKACRQLKKIIDEGDYDVIHTHTPVGSIVTRWAAKAAHKKGTKIIYTCHGFHFYEGAPKQNWRIYYPIEKKMAKRTDLLITINHEDYERAKKDFACPVKMIDGAGVDTSKFKKMTL